LSPHLALSPRTNKPIPEILYRKGSSNEAGALSLRAELHHDLATTEELLLDKDVAYMHDFLSTMTQLELYTKLLHKIRSGYALDPTYYNMTLPNGVHSDTTDNLHWMAD
jgi:hypothetical protein